MKSVPNDESKEVTGSPDRRQLERRGLFENDQQLKTARSDLQAARVRRTIVHRNDELPGSVSHS